MPKSDFLNPDGSWKCIKCGACCKVMGLLYPDYDRGDYACINLLRDNTCGIYNDRPLVCRVPKKLKKEHSLELANACNTLYEIFKEPTDD